MTWPNNPFIYEINTWPWLDSISRSRGELTTLANVPDDILDQLAGLNLDAVWLMGVWERSPAGIAIARAHTDLQNEFHRALPDFTPAVTFTLIVSSTFVLPSPLHSSQGSFMICPSPLH